MTTVSVDKLLDRACPVCGSRESKLFLRKHELRLARCLGCSMIYANPVADAMATGAFYDQSGGEYLATDKLEGDYADVRFQRELRLFRSYCPGGSVLDVGCSSGGFLFQLNRRHPGEYDVLGADVSGAPLDYAEKMGVPVIRGDFQAHIFDKQFDAVTFWAVMEHLFEPQTFLKKAASILKPGGVCFILVPNISSLAVRALGAKYRYIFAEHLNYFAPASLRRFASREFEVLNLVSTHFNPVVIWQDYRLGGREVSRNKRAQLLKRTNAWKKSRFLLPAKLIYHATEYLLAKLWLADNLVVIARKI